jgi:hypothetical protein
MTAKMQIYILKCDKLKVADEDGVTSEIKMSLMKYLTVYCS